MRRPRFWRDQGHWNDTVVVLAQLAGMMAGTALGWWLECPWLMAAGGLAGLGGGFLGGVFLVAILCRYFVDR